MRFNTYGEIALLVRSSAFCPAFGRLPSSTASFRPTALEKIRGLDAKCISNPTYNTHSRRHICALDCTDIARTQLRFLGKRFLRPFPGVTQAAHIRRYDLLDFHRGMEAESRTFIPGTNIPIRRRPCYDRPSPNLRVCISSEQRDAPIASPSE
jgi:hypothetical protein